MLEARRPFLCPPPGLSEGDGAAGPAGDPAPGGRAEDPAAAELVPDGAGAQALPADAAGGHHDPGAKGTRGAGGEAGRGHAHPAPERPLHSQACWRSYRVRRALERTQAAVFLQAAWRGYRQRAAYRRQRQSIIRLQSLVVP